MCTQTPKVHGPLGPQGAFRVPLLQTWGLDEASLDLRCGVPMETCKVAPCIAYEATTVWLIDFVLAQDRFSGPKLLRALGGLGALSGRAPFFSYIMYVCLSVFDFYIGRRWRISKGGRAPPLFFGGSPIK